MSAVSGKNPGGQVPPGTGGNAGPDKESGLFAANQQTPANGQPPGNTQQPNLLDRVFAGKGSWSELAHPTVSREVTTRERDPEFGSTLQSCPGTVSQEASSATNKPGNKPVAGFPVPTDDD